MCLTGPALHHIGFHENTRLRERTGGNLKEQSNTSCWLLQPGVLQISRGGLAQCVSITTVEVEIAGSNPQLPASLMNG